MPRHKEAVAGNFYATTAMMMHVLMAVWVTLSAVKHSDSHSPLKRLVMQQQNRWEAVPENTNMCLRIWTSKVYPPRCITTSETSRWTSNQCTDRFSSERQPQKTTWWFLMMSILGTEPYLLMKIGRAPNRALFWTICDRSLCNTNAIVSCI